MTFSPRDLLAAVLMASGASVASAQAPTPPLPYVAVHNPEFVAASQADFLRDDDIVLGVSSGHVARAYPAADLTQHGAVSDTVPDGPISVTWCGVCNTGLVFRAVVNGRTLHFQYDRMVGGNEVQKDAETGSSWQQATGKAIDGPLEGTRLTLYPVVRTTWAAWRTQYPHSTVLKPLPGYIERMPAAAQRIKDVTRFAPEGAPRGALALDGRLPPRETVAGVEVGGDALALPFPELRIARVVNERVGDLPVLVVHQPASDTTTAFDARVKGRVLRFEPAGADAAMVRDRETRSTWDAYGLALEGPLKGTQLTRIALVPQFWFAWSQFRPGTRVFRAAAVAASAGQVRSDQCLNHELENIPVTRGRALPPGVALDDLDFHVVGPLDECRAHAVVRARSAQHLHAFAPQAGQRHVEGVDADPDVIDHPPAVGGVLGASLPLAAVQRPGVRGRVPEERHRIDL